MSEHDGRCRTCGRPLGGDEHEVDGVPGVFHLECLPGQVRAQSEPVAWRVGAGLLGISTAPKDHPVLAWCSHEADPYVADEGDGMLTLYAAHYEGTSHAPTGWHIVEWGGGFADCADDGGACLTDWWFVAGSEFEVAANPVFWCDLPQLAHASDCALHSGPAYTPGPCDCGADPGMTPEQYGSEFPAPPAASEPAAGPDDGSCVRCGSVPRNASGLCATCLDEDAVRAGEVEDEASQALWRQTLDQERVPAAPPAESGEVVLSAEHAWNARADAANQWDDLGGEEREDIIAIWEHGYAAGRKDQLTATPPTAPAAARSAAEEMRTKAAKLVFEARGEFGSIALAERIMGIPLAGEGA